jgi:glutamyl-tRNA reductase
VNILLAGLSHRTAPLELRERFAVDDPRPVLEKLVAADEIDEAFVLSTCNRTEVLVRARELEPARERVRSLFTRELVEDDVPQRQVEEALYEYSDLAAMQHVFRVACSLDSMVVGEPQILGQVKEAYRCAAGVGATGVILGRLFNRAFATAKRVRSETRIAERPISVARVAVDLAGQIFESLEDKRALLVGAGDMGQIALDALRGAGLRHLCVANRTLERARALAERFRARAGGFDALPGLLAEADVVLTSVGGGEPVLTRPLVEEAMRGRGHRPMFVIDIGVPRNVDAAVNEVEAVYLYDIDDLDRVAAANAEERAREVDRAEEIVLEERECFDGWIAGLQTVPTIRHLRTRGEAIRERELARALGRLDLSDGQREGVEALTRAIVNKVLHAPVSRLRNENDREGGITYLEAARVLFALDDPKAPGAEADTDPDAFDPE